MNDTERTVLTLIVVLILVPVLLGTVMMGAMGPGMMGGGWGGWDGWSPWRAVLSVFSGLLLVGGIAAIAWWAFTRGARVEAAAPGNDARSVLDARYARGELTREQYQQMRSDLES